MSFIVTLKTFALVLIQHYPNTYPKIYPFYSSHDYDYKDFYHAPIQAYTLSAKPWSFQQGLSQLWEMILHNRPKRIETTLFSIRYVDIDVVKFVLHRERISVAIFLRGPSSIGKMTLVKKLQDNLNTPYLHIDMLYN